MSRLSTNHHEHLDSGRTSAQDICTVPHSLNDINLSPASIQHVSHLPEICSTPDKENKRLNNFHSDKADKKMTRHLDDRIRVLPKINNPKAEDRLRALMNLLDKKNPDIQESKRRASNSRVKGEGVSMEEKRKVHLVLPPLTSLTPKPAKQADIESMKKMFAQSPSRKPIFRIQEVAASKESTIRLVPKFLDPLRIENKENRVENVRKGSVNIKDSKRVSFRHHSQNRSDEKSSPSETESTPKYKKLVFKKYKKEKKSVAPLPQPSMNFDMRVHQVSIDDALEKLNQLTNQSNNARKDLLKIQENALAIRLSYERNHRNDKRMNCKSETRNP